MMHVYVDGTLKLKQNHVYFSQIQDQTAIGERKWCDFVAYTNKRIAIERIPFNDTFWESELLPKLTDFCLGTGVPRHRDGVVRPYVRTYVRTYVRSYVFSELCSIFQYVIKWWLRALQLSGSREQK